MKKTFLVIAVIIISSFIWIACRNENVESTEVDMKTFKNTADLFSYAKVHGELLRKSEKNLKQRVVIATINKSSTVDTLSLINAYEEDAYNYFSANPIEFNGQNVTIENWMKIDDDTQMKMFRSTDEVKPYLFTDEVLNYYIKIKAIIDESETPNQVETSLTSLFDQLENDTYSTQNKLAIQIMIGVAYDSFSYWYQYYGMENIFIVEGKPKKSFFTNNIYADIVGAGQGALYGAVAGPLGSIMVGISFGFIGSGVSQALQNGLSH